ncbi:hypothetical protein HMPREF0972_02572 [Actinomyces sp. oral taxon 848 str. F0332]|nr:hypothetical protein HMPREF0972_02572 [Actinomyces sp. oral taxon 848 str. F0332]
MQARRFPRSGASLSKELGLPLFAFGRVAFQGTRPAAFRVQSS